MFIANRRAKFANQRAAVGDDEDMAAADNFKEIGVDLRAGTDIDLQFFGEFASEGAGRVFARLGAAAWQLPFVPGVMNQHNLAVYEQHALD